MKNNMLLRSGDYISTLVEKQVVDFTSSKLMSHFGFTINLKDEGSFGYILKNFIKKYDKNFKIHMDGTDDYPYPNTSMYVFPITENTFVLVKYHYRDIFNIGIENYVNSLYIFGKHSPKYYNEAKNTINKYNEELSMFFVSGSKMNSKEGVQSEAFDSTVDDMVGRDIDTLFFEDHVKESIINHIDSFLKNKDLYQNRSLMYKTGIFFYGEPGTGKTSLATAIATKYKLDMIIINMPTFCGLNIEKLTSCLNADKKMYLVLLEDIDTVFGSLDRESEDSKANNKIIGKLLQFLDSNSSPTNVIFIATTNHPELFMSNPSDDKAEVDKLDKAIVRSGRFDLKVEVRGIGKSKSIDMCKSFNLSEKEIESTLSGETFPINQSYLQNKILETINKR